jgi:hypothetical protein
MTAHARRTHATSGGAGRMHTGTADINRKRRRWRRDNPIADVAGERWRNNSTAAVGPLSGAGRTASTLPPAGGGGGAFFAGPPMATVPQVDAAEDNNDDGSKGGPAAAGGEEGQRRQAVGEGRGVCVGYWTCSM